LRLVVPAITECTDGRRDLRAIVRSARAVTLPPRPANAKSGCAA